MHNPCCVFEATEPAALTGTVGSLWGVRWLPNAVVGAEVTVHGVLSEAVSVFTVEGTVNTLIFFRANKFSIHWDVGLVTRGSCSERNNNSKVLSNECIIVR